MYSPPPPGIVTTATIGEHSTRIRAALLRLREAYDFAHDLGVGLWDFAVEIQALRAAGLGNSELRWLICKEYVLHAGEVTPLGENHRAFRPIGRFNLSKRTCFVLTEQGAAQAIGEYHPSVLGSGPDHGTNGHIHDGRIHLTNGHVPPATASPVALPPPTRPYWDRDRQELRIGLVIVKQYKVPAPNQETVLAAFEEDGWPHRIDDPIPPHPDQDPKRRLHDTINSLNRNQKTSLIHFLGDGSGQGVRWEPRPHTNGHEAAAPHADSRRDAGPR